MEHFPTYITSKMEHFPTFPLFPTFSPKMFHFSNLEHFPICIASKMSFQNAEHECVNLHGLQGLVWTTPFWAKFISFLFYFFFKYFSPRREKEKLHSLSERLEYLSVMGALLRALHKPLNTIVLWYTMGFRWGRQFPPLLWCRETQKKEEKYGIFFSVWRLSQKPNPSKIKRKIYAKISKYILPWNSYWSDVYLECIFIHTFCHEIDIEVIYILNVYFRM